MHIDNALVIYKNILQNLDKGDGCISVMYSILALARETGAY